jgi:hypothetical protein
MSDFRDTDSRLRNPDSPMDPLEPATGRAAAGYNSTWGWIIGALVFAVILAFVFTMGDDGTRVAGPNATPPVTTGAAPPPAPRAPATTGQATPAPSSQTPATTTGQGPTR